MPTKRPNQRYHALDSMRAIMMLLGVVLHAAVAFSITGGWPFKQPELTQVFDPLLYFIHLFRMPAFFLLAGFFGALLLQRRSTRRFLANRTKRILLPFIVFWLIMFPIFVYFINYAELRTQPDAAMQVVHIMLANEFWVLAHPGHFWFLEYLALLLAIVFGFQRWVVPLIAESFKDRFAYHFRRSLKTGSLAFICALFTATTLGFMPGADLATPEGFMPQASILSAYLVFFGFGWVLYAHRDLLPQFEPTRWRFTALGLLCFAAGMTIVLMLRHAVIEGSEFLYWSLTTLNALTMWYLIIGFLGWFLHAQKKESPLMRYLSDSSYWVYIVHPIPIMTLQLMLWDTSYPPVAKAGLVLLLSIPPLYLSYHFLVRPTFIGAFLNGRRYPIKWPSFRLKNPGRLTPPLEPSDEAPVEATNVA